MIMHSSLPLSASNSHTHKYFVSSLGDGFQKIPSQKTCWGWKGEKKKRERKQKQSAWSDSLSSRGPKCWKRGEESTDLQLLHRSLFQLNENKRNTKGLGIKTELVREGSFFRYFPLLLYLLSPLVNMERMWISAVWMEDRFFFPDSKIPQVNVCEDRMRVSHPAIRHNDRGGSKIKCKKKKWRENKRRGLGGRKHSKTEK